MQMFVAMTLALFGWVLISTAEDNWPQFRGPDGQGHSDAKGLPLTWSETQNVKWKTSIHGRAWSSPVIWGKQIWLTTATEDGHELFAVCIDRDSGKIVHDLNLFHVKDPEFVLKFNTHASPTPVIEAGRVYITFGSAGTACLDSATGRVIWQRRDLECNHFRGAGSSPILFENLFILNYDGSDFQYVVALDKSTGKTVWKTNRSVDFQDLDLKTGKPKADGDYRKGFCTPLVATLDGKPVMIDPGSKAVYAYDPRTGKELWRAEERRFHSVAIRPCVGNGLIYVGTGQAKCEFWAITPGGSGLLNDSQIAWKMTKNVPNKPSPLLVGDLLFMVDDAGIATCTDAKTGENIWRQRIGGNHSASPLGAEGRVYFFDDAGKATVIEAGREFKVLAESTLPDGFMASPAVSGKAMFLRTRTALYRIEADR